MLLFKRDPSGLYLSTDQNDARVAFLFQDSTQTPPTFQLTGQSWADPNSAGYLAFFAPSSTRVWNTFAAGVRAAFAQNDNSGPQIGWFPEPLTSVTPGPTIFLVGQGTPPTLSQSFNLVFRNSTCVVQPPQFGGSAPVQFDDSSNSIVISGLASVQLSVTLPSGSAITFPTDGPAITTLSLPLTGALAGVATFAIQIDAGSLSQFEAGMMYFSPVGGELIAALNYPAFRAPVGTSAPLNFNVSLDVLAPLCPTRSFFQFGDPLLGSYFVTATGKPFAFQTVGGTDITKMSRLVFAGRPQSSPTDTAFYYLTPAGQFGLTIDGGGTSPQTAQPTVTQMLCGVTGTEFLRVGVGTTPDALEFVPGGAAWRLTVDPSSTAPVYLDHTATTSWARVVTTNGAYISQPERSPLFSQSSNAVANVAASGLSVYVLDFDPTDAWRPAETHGDVPLVPLVPYAGLDFTTNPNINLPQYLEMESGALNPSRANAFVVAPAVQARGVRALTSDTSKLAMTPQGMLVGLKGDPAVWDALQIAISNAITPILEFDGMGPSIRKAVQKNQIFTVVSVNPANPGNAKPPNPSLFTFDKRFLEIGDWTFDLSPAGLAAPDKTPPIFIMKFYPGKSINDLVGAVSLWSEPETFNADPTLI